MWTGGFYIWRTTNQANSWVQASAITAGNGSVSAVATAPSNSNNVIVGMSDGYIHYNTAALSATSATNWPSTRPRTEFVSSVAFDPSNASVAYATYETFSGDSVYKTVDSGATWVAIPGTGVNVLPKVPAHAVAVDPTNPSRIYVGTDIGVYTTLDGGANWYREVTGFGNVSVEHLEINGSWHPAAVCIHPWPGCLARRPEPLKSAGADDGPSSIRRPGQILGDRRCRSTENKERPRAPS